MEAVEAREPGWPSPAGIARRAARWHIECSAMSWKHLGETFDIHGGGIDLVFPHHENEIAQSRCAFHSKVMANFWMHNGFLQVEGEKMCKSLGNFATIREVLADWPGDVVRLAMLRTHYRQPINWTMKVLEDAEKSWLDSSTLRRPSRAESGCAGARCARDDLNTPEAIAELHRLEERGRPQGACRHARFFSLRAAIDLCGRAGEASARSRRSAERRSNSLIDARNAARKAKNFNESDRIRDELATMGVVLKDSKDGTTWEVAR